MRQFGKISLSIKLSLMLLLVLGVLLLATVLLLISNTATLTEEIGSERINEEVSIMKNHLSEVEKQLTVSVNFTASSIPLIQAVGRRNADTVLGLIETANKSLLLDDIDVIDGDGKSLVDLKPSTTADATMHLLDGGLNGTSKTGVIVKDVDGKVTVNLSAIAPINNIRQGTVLGAIQMSKRIDDEFLRSLAFERSGVYLGLVYNDQIMARTTASQSDDPKILHGNIAFDSGLASAAGKGQPVVLDRLIANGNVPYAVAYIPLSANAGDSVASLMILVELTQISSFQINTLVNTLVVFTVLALVAIAIIYLSLGKIVIYPLTTLKTIAGEITSGHYDQRIPVGSRDEVGQLAETFNHMAEAIQQREASIQAARAQAERSDQVKSAFLASMSHELRTPLNAVINFTRFVIDGDTGPVNEQQTELLTEVVSSAKHLLNLINDVLDMSKIEAGSLNLFIEDDVNLNALVNNVVTTGRALLAGKPTRLNSEVDENLPLIRADRQRILQILLNVVSNACKFTEEGDIKIKVTQKDGEVLIAVADTGPGIAPEDQAMVFEAFKQTKTGLRQGGGTGLGMPIAKNLAEAHGGRMWLESEYGKGTTFYVALPIRSDELVPMTA